MARDDRRMTFIVVPHGGGDLGTRSFEVSYRRLRLAALVAAAGFAVFLAMAISYAFVASRAARVPALEREVAALQADRARVAQLQRVLARMEQQYGQVRAMLGAEAPPAVDSLAAPAAEGDAPAPEDDPAPPDAAAGGDSEPTGWPLAARGFVTRGHLARVPGRHPGLDIAVPTGTRILASGAGEVVEAGEDSLYGRFVRIRHGGGWESVYGHASRVLVRAGQRVRAGQPIALSGNTGVSTAPHLHFELRRDGRAVDPREYVTNPDE